MLTQLVVVKNFSYFGYTGKLFASELGFAEEDFALGSRSQLLYPRNLEVVCIFRLLLTLYVKDLSLDAEIQQFADVLRYQKVGCVLWNVIVRVKS